MTTTKPPPLKRVKHLVYDLRSSHVPEFLIISTAAACVINSTFQSLGYEYRFFPISHRKGDPGEGSD